MAFPKEERDELRGLHGIAHNPLLWGSDSPLVQKDVNEANEARYRMLDLLDTCLPRLLDALDAAEAERDTANARIQQVHDWYADRWARLRAFLAKGSDMEKGACDIMANGHLLTDQDRKSAVALATERAEAADAKLAALVDALSKIAQPTYGTETHDTDSERADVYWQHIERFQRTARQALAAAKDPPCAT